MTGPRVGSRSWALERMAPGDVLLFPAPAGRTAALMQQLRTDIGRVGGDARTFRQSLILGIEVATREALDIVKVTRL